MEADRVTRLRATWRRPALLRAVPTRPAVVESGGMGRPVQDQSGDESDAVVDVFHNWSRVE